MSVFDLEKHKCKHCNTSFSLSIHSGNEPQALGYCCEECCKEALDYLGFYKWFKHLLNKCNSCFERDILRDNKNVLWDTWCDREIKRLEKLKEE